MRSAGIIYIFCLVAAVSTVSIVQAQSSGDSLVAIALSDDLCGESSGNFLPLPKHDSAEANAGNLSSIIDREFGENCKINGLLLQGSITTETLPQLNLGLELLEMRRNDSMVTGNKLWLDSPGGLISEAMKIGDVIASHEMEAYTVFNGHCLSSCVLIYAAAKIRSGIGDIGIHRPFSYEISTNSLSYSQYLDRYEEITPILKNYLSKYGVSPALVDAMNVIPSDDIRILDRNERDEFGLGFENVAAKEFEKAQTIEICGEEFYNLHREFQDTLANCRIDSGTDAISDTSCWDSTRVKFPEHRAQFESCQVEIDESKLNIDHQ